MAGVVAVMWLLEIIDAATGGALDTLGIHARTVDGLWQIFTAPWLHHGWAHLAGNTIPLLVLGWLVLMDSTRTWLVSALIVTVRSGLFAWVASPSGSVTLGASGVVFGWLTFLLVKGIFTRDIGDIVLAVIVLFVYGGVLWGILPTASGVSWQAHLGGAAGGVLAAWLLTLTEREQRSRMIASRP
ncbi:MAG: rhomboid family intramembrane serine protease [Acidipropionibacterium jensenii]|uniref:rhomboid family intramembrane serine protease n=1 Tax=Acidipropionibacterium jensenii TaxID=1749 RepID=UPI0026472564|nr:rhomboid family intramembrane serine protease [Acidipropionibacterium jensenii]MDN6440621.1 rhomboid family intramembrane serine protease [Acidipropionibacterium jensenii]